MKYRYTMLLSPVVESQLLSSFENTKVKLIIKVPVEIECDRDEKQEIEDLKSKMYTKTPDGMYEFVGFEDLVKIIK